MATLAVIADELYGLPPQEFTAARNARADELRATDRGLSDAVRALRKATPAAWVVDLLAREHADQLAELVELGERWRAAQSSGDRAEFAKLGRERREAVAALVAEGASAADGHGHSVTRAVLDLVATTLHAAMSDAGAASAVRRGLLVKELQSVGFEPVDLAGAVALDDGGSAPPRAERPKLRVVKDPDAELRLQRKEAREALRDAEREAKDAEREARDSAERAEAGEARRGELEDERDELEARLDRTRKALAAAERELRDLDRDRGVAERAADRAREALERARQRVDALE